MGLTVETTKQIPSLKALFVGKVGVGPLRWLAVHQIRRHQGLRKPFGLGCQEPIGSCQGFRILALEKKMKMID